MSANRQSTDPEFDEDDASDLSTLEWQARFASVPVRRGRPPLDEPKVSTTIRLDADVLEKFRATGPGWQGRINAVLKAAKP
ncbi:MAG: BrnA antitoxin family protein [Amaricoccus sp.]